MSSPDVEGKSAATSLDAERERLRKAGYTDAEVSQILITRELGASQQPGGTPGQGVMSNVVSSIVAIAGHARGYIVATKADFITLFGTAAPAARAKAAGSLVLKAVIVAVLGYAALQEWYQHIVYATQQAAADANFKCQTRGGCPGLATGLEEPQLSPEQIEREQAKFVAIYNQAEQIALNSPVVKAPDGRMVHEIGVIPQHDFIYVWLKTKGTVLPNTPSIKTDAGKDLYQDVPKWWIAAEASPR